MVSILLTLLLFSVEGRQPPQALGFYVIVHPQNPVSTVGRKFLSEVFLKRATFWLDDEVIQPVDLKDDSPIRRLFAEQVLKRSMNGVKSFWQQIIFSGRGVPPPELDSDAAVVQYVRRHRGGIGYVSTTADLEGVKVLEVR